MTWLVRWLVIYRDGLLSAECRQSPIHIVTRPGVEQLHWPLPHVTTPRSYYLLWMWRDSAGGRRMSRARQVLCQNAMLMASAPDQVARTDAKNIPYARVLPGANVAKLSHSRRCLEAPFPFDSCPGVGPWRRWGRPSGDVVSIVNTTGATCRVRVNKTNYCATTSWSIAFDNSHHCCRRLCCCCCCCYYIGRHARYGLYMRWQLSNTYTQIV